MCLLTKLKKESKGKEVIESASAALIWLALEYCMVLHGYSQAIGRCCTVDLAQEEWYKLLPAKER